MRNAWIALIVVGIGCSGSGAGGSGGGTGGSGAGGSAPSVATIADYCASVVNVAADYEVRCYGGTADMWRGVFAGLDCAATSAQQAAGLLTYDAASAAQCLDLFGQTTCGSQTAPVCDRAVAGTVAAGGSCKKRTMGFSECAPGTYCDALFRSCTGTCTAYVPVGGVCASATGATSGRCADGSGCDSTSKTCQPDLSEGQACSTSNARGCASTLYCDRPVAGDGGVSNAGVCRARKTSGACTSSTECLNGSCTGPTGAMTCAPWKMAGAACVPGKRECFLLFHCGADGVCTDATLAENASCGGQSGEYVACADGLYCTDSLTGTCQKKKPAESACTATPSDQCDGTNAYCDQTTLKCVSCG